MPAAGRGWFLRRWHLVWRFAYFLQSYRKTWYFPEVHQKTVFWWKVTFQSVSDGCLRHRHDTNRPMAGAATGSAAASLFCPPRKDRLGQRSRADKLPWKHCGIPRFRCCNYNSDPAWRCRCLLLCDLFQRQWPGHHGCNPPAAFPQYPSDGRQRSSGKLQTEQGRQANWQSLSESRTGRGTWSLFRM